jgi:predicted nucleic acid-binding Zn ribbon protein
MTTTGMICLVFVVIVAAIGRCMKKMKRRIDDDRICVCCGREIPEGLQYCLICGYEVKGKQRQIDRIRNMSVEEMAEWFYSIANVKYGCWLPISCLDSDCKVCIKKWLESEVDSE